MNEIKCPKCGEVFQVDEAGYAAIVKQVKDKEFEREKKTHIELALKEAAEKHVREISIKQEMIDDLLKQIELNEKDAKLDLANALNEKGIQHQKVLVERDQRISDLENKLEMLERAKENDVNLATIEIENQYQY